MSIKRIVKVYYDKPNYIKPKEVTKAFSLYDKRNDLRKQLNSTTSKTGKIDLKGEIAEIGEELRMVMNVITPGKLTWGLAEHTDQDSSFSVITITEKVEDELSFKSQDEE